MSVTIHSIPDNHISAYVPVEYNFTSTYTGRDGAYTNVSADADGNAVFTVTGIAKVARTIKVDGIMTISNALNSDYDGEYTVISASNNGEVVLNTPFIGNSAGNFSYDRLNARMICDIYVDGSFLIRKTRRVNSDNRFVFDFSREIQISIANDLEPLDMGSTSPIPSISPESTVSIHAQYAEAEDVIVNGIAESVLSLDAFGDLRSTDNSVVVNAIVPYIEWELGSVNGTIYNNSTDLSDFKIKSASTTNRFLTNSPNIINIGRNDFYQLSFMIDYDAAVDYERTIVTYDSSGAILATNRKTASAATDSVWSMRTGGRNLGILGSASIARYDVTLTDGNNSDAAMSETITFIIDDTCHQSKTRFVWLNPRGGYDAFNFYSPRRLNSVVKKQLFRKSRSYPVVIGNREDSVIDVNSRDSIMVKTSKVSAQDAEWLIELFESPEVFIELEDGNALHDKLIPITVLDRSGDITNSYDSLHSVSLQYVHGFSKKHLRAN